MALAIAFRSHASLFKLLYIEKGGREDDVIELVACWEEPWLRALWGEHWLKASCDEEVL